LNFIVNLNSRNINVKLINKRNVKHCYLRVVENNMLQITANKYFTVDDAKKLINKKSDWILGHLSKATKNLLENEYYYLGEIYAVSYLTEEKLIKFYKEKAEEIITPLVEKNSKLMELFPSSLKYRNNKTRWGSCSYKNGINLNLNLLKYPIYVIEYVVIHELAHIKHKNHSRDFWKLVEKFCPNYKNCEKILKTF